jgi:outer membrane protein assembly factor BamD (BamD/ComL family)
VAICASKASGKSGYDQELTTQAIQEFEEFTRNNPNSELAKKALEEKNRLNEKRTDSYFKTATFYERIGKYQSAILYYKKIIDEFQDASVAPSALERLKVLEKRLNKKG